MKINIFINATYAWLHECASKYVFHICRQIFITQIERNWFECERRPGGHHTCEWGVQSDKREYFFIIMYTLIYENLQIKVLNICKLLKKLNNFKTVDTLN